MRRKRDQGAEALTAVSPLAVLEQGFGKGAWHGPDLAAAIAGVSPDLALHRPASGRHNIAEITLHHAWCIHSVVGSLTGEPEAPFPIDGEDWFEVGPERGPGWEEVRSILEARQARLLEVVEGTARVEIASSLSEQERFGLVLGVTCHAVYHAGQIQLVKRLLAVADEPSSDVYYIGTYDIVDVDAFSAYAPTVFDLLPRYGGEVLASDTSAFVVEGSARTMNAIIRFPSREAALGLYNDPAYQEAKRIRQRATANVSMVLADAWPGGNGDG